MNIYAAPGAPLDSAAGERMARPVSVFLVQALATVAFVLIALLALVASFARYRAGIPISRDDGLFLLGMAVALCTVLLGIVVGLERRMKAACAAAVITVSIPAVGILIFWLRLPSLGGVPAWLGQFAAMSMLMAPFLYWAYALGFSTKAKTYFRLRRPTEESAPAQ